METKFIMCVQCENEFEFTPGEQKYYRDKGFDDPKRCPVCRRHKSRANQDKARKKEKKWDHQWSKYEFEREE